MTPTTPLYPVKVQEAIEKGLNKEEWYFVIRKNGMKSVWKGDEINHEENIGNPMVYVLLPKPEAAEISEEEIEKLADQYRFKQSGSTVRGPGWLDYIAGLRMGLSLPSSNRQTEVSKERIVCAANFYNDGNVHDHGYTNTPSTGFVICGFRHSDCINLFAQIVGFPYSDVGLRIKMTEVQGFITTAKKFVTRKQALSIAKEAGQIITGEGNGSLGLFSEDLY